MRPMSLNSDAGLVPSSNDMRPYHLFEKYGEQFVYDLATGNVFHIDEATSKLLAASLNPSVAPECFPTEADQAILDEFDALRKRGCFKKPNYNRDEDMMGSMVSSRLAKRWNTLELCLAETCNLACTYCYCGTGRNMPRQGLMTRETARKSIDWLIESSCEAAEIRIVFFGGEPLLNRKVFAFSIEYAKEQAAQRNKKVRFGMTTNGTLLDDEAIRYIKEENFGLMVSLDGPREIHDRQRTFHDGRGSYEDAAAGIKKLMARRRRVTVRCTLTNDAPRLRELISFFEDFGFTRIAIGCARNESSPSPADCRKEDYLDHDMQQESDIIPYIVECLAKGEIPKYFPYTFFEGRLSEAALDENFKRFRCGACFGTMTVGADGSLYPCHRFVGRSQYIIGHVRTGVDTGRIEDFWRKYNRLVNGSCASCWARLSCRGPCPWEAARADGEFHPPEQWQCDLIRRHSERTAWLQWYAATNYPELYKQLC